MDEKPVTLVLLPGLDGTGKLFAPLIDCLPAWIEPQVVSYPTDQPLDYEALHARIVQCLPDGADFVIVGESFSGPLAVMAAEKKPAGLRGIVLCASFVRNPFRILPAWAGALSVGPVYEFWPLTIRLRAILARGQYATLANIALDAIKSVSPKVIARRVKSILTVNVEPVLANLDVPILYLAGRKDRLIRKHNATAIKKIRPDMRLVELNTNHFVLQLEPQRSVAALEQFIRSTGRGQMDRKTA